MQNKSCYCSYDDYSVIFDCQTGCFSVSVKGKTVLCDGHLLLKKQECDSCVSLDTYGTFVYTRIYSNSVYGVNIQFTDGADLADSSVKILVGRDGVHFQVSEMPGYVWSVSGRLLWGEDMEKDTFAMSDTAIEKGRIRSAIGPATSIRDTILYDRKTDNAFCLEAETVRLSFDWDSASYQCSLSAVADTKQQFDFFVKNHVLAQQYDIEFLPINKNSTFSKPPAGWMTWYAVKFNACEESVLRNVHFQEKYLKKYGADAIWIDWEWYHQDMSGRREDGVDTFHPDLKKYPNGLKYISDEIKKSGFVPALWIGFTNEPAIFDFMKKYPDLLLCEKKTWCGTYFYDFSHPAYLNEYLPKALAQVADWGYEAVKFDTLPNAIYYHEEFHDNMCDPTLTTKEAFRNVIKKARELIGKDVYMMSCASCNDPHFLWAADIFDGGRVGGDIFRWKDFLWEGVGRVLRYYPLHNVVLYTDPDNLVLRDEFNTSNQALSRIAFVSLMGLPMTFGDDFAILPEERVKMLQKCLPVMDIHPMDLKTLPLPEGTQKERDTGHWESDFPQDKILLNLAVEKPFIRYNVVDVFNTTDEPQCVGISLEKDLYLESGEYLVFDYVHQKFLGCITDRMDLELEPCESRILRFCKKTDRPQILSTSRHITQGAAELRDVKWDEDSRTLHICSDMIADENYQIYIYVPDGYETAECAKEEDHVFCLNRISKTGGVQDIFIHF